MLRDLFFCPVLFFFVRCGGPKNSRPPEAPDEKNEILTNRSQKWDEDHETLANSNQHGDEEHETHANSSKGEDAEHENHTIAAQTA